MLLLTLRHPSDGVDVPLPDYHGSPSRRATFLARVYMFCVLFRGVLARKTLPSVPPGPTPKRVGKDKHTQFKYTHRT